ncbi:unnamed protein product [Vitrella brassicaformis CCMP3155]|uniref:Rieske domain-containing protein n=2 Tax=Vitrella brassicaformis TaxID=1169539 RepID=A0A0G4H889_VITBC|nr:unnamed protein product [Vitrella brassicaformis CCMP3155]|eukprot:CEM40133.1 unnamed protein product [Vitrella brassicaformis CCMP3155]
MCHLALLSLLAPAAYVTAAEAAFRRLDSAFAPPGTLFHQPAKRHALSSLREALHKGTAEAVLLTREPATDTAMQQWTGTFTLPTEHHQPAADSSSGREQYNWLQAWYPVLLSESADRGRAHAVRVLGSSFCVWHDGNAWRCYVDRCPHRLAPLSEGIVDKYQHTITCAYHGWAFGGPDGKCLDIPQAKNTNVKFATKNKRACAQAVPCQVRQGLVWIWLDLSPEGLALANVTEPAVVPELDEPAFKKTEAEGRHMFYMRDMPYGCEALLENAIDPSHVPVTHHNALTLQGARMSRTTTKPLDMVLKERDVSMREGFTTIVRSGGSKAFDSYTVSFMPPGRLMYRTQKGDRINYSIFYCVPQEPGRSRFFLRAASTLPQPYDWLPQWVRHTWETAFLNQDMVFPHEQERHLLNLKAAMESDSPHEATVDRLYYMPAAADVPIRAVRRWLQRFSYPGVIPNFININPVLKGSSALGPAERSRERLLTAWDSHTKYCPYCRGAYRNLTLIKYFAIGVALLSSSSSFAAIMLRRVGMSGTLALSAALGGLLARWLHVFTRRFVYEDFSHQLNQEDYILAANRLRNL